MGRVQMRGLPETRTPETGLGNQGVRTAITEDSTVQLLLADNAPAAGASRGASAIATAACDWRVVGGGHTMRLVSWWACPPAREYVQASQRHGPVGDDVSRQQCADNQACPEHRD